MKSQEIKGFVDPRLINTHMLAAEKNGKPVLACLQMKYTDRRLHLVTTNGRILLHTSIGDSGPVLEDMPDFEVAVKITRKLKCKSDEIAIEFTIKDGKVFFKGVDSFDAFEVLQDKFPSYETVEARDLARMPLERCVIVNPKYLEIVYEYVGEGEYVRPYSIGSSEYQPVFYKRRDDDHDEIREAYVMPIRVN